MTPAEQHDTLVRLVETIKHLAKAVDGITERLNQIPTRSEMADKFVSSARFEDLEDKFEALSAEVKRSSLGSALEFAKRVAAWIAAIGAGGYALFETIFWFAGKRP